MKKLLLLFGLGLAMSCNPVIAQDSLMLKISKLELKQHNAGVNMIDFHKQFKEGLYVTTVGVAMITAGAILSNTKNLDKRRSAYPYLYFGYCITFLGVAINIDSFTFIRLAGIDLK